MFQTFWIKRNPCKREIIFGRSNSVSLRFLWLTILLSGINGSLAATNNITNTTATATTTTTTTTYPITTITINATPIISSKLSTTTPTSTDKLIRDILLNQSSNYYDELVLEQLLAAANMSSPPPETWRAIVQLLNKQAANNNENSNNNNEADSGTDSTAKNTPATNSASTKTKQISLLTLKQEEDGDNDTDGLDGQIDSDNLTINRRNGAAKIESAIDEFPPDFMSDQWRQNGGFLIHILIFIYLSIVLAVICDNYFLKSLEFISEALHLSSDIAGATFMAIGTSAPELFTSVIGVFISDNDIGTGTIVGSAVFNLIAIPGACGFAAYYNLKTMPKINPFPIIRDTIFYVLTIITLILCIKDNKVDWIESITLIALYIIYIIIMYFNAQISHLVGNQQPYRHCSDEYLMIGGGNGEDGQKKTNQSKRKQAEMEQTSNMDMVVVHDDETQPLLLTDDSVKRLSPPPAYQSGNVAYSNEIIPQQKSPTSNRTKDIDLSKIQLTLAENGKFKEIKHQNGDSKRSSGTAGKHSQMTDIEQSIEMDTIDTDWTDNPFIQFILFPFRLIFFITLPKPTRFCFVVTFVSSIVWIACLTYFIVWMVTLVGYTLGIPDTVSGITVLAAGTSIPELISSYLIVKKAGLADMAICNSIGSNIFDILFCLGLPWLLKSSIVIVTNGFGLATLANSYIPIQSTALPITSLTLLLTIGAMILIFKASHWRLNLHLGILCSIVYVIFVVTSTSLELNI